MVYAISGMKVTYELHLARYESDKVGDHDRGTASNQNSSRSRVQLFGPESEEVVGRDVGALIDGVDIGTKSHDRDPHRQREPQ